MTTSSNSISFSQYLCVPHVAAAYFVHDDVRDAGFPFFHFNVHKEGDTVEYLGWNADGTGEIHAVSIRAGNWLLVVDRPRGAVQDAPNAPVTGSKTLWAALGGPAVAVLAIVGGLAKCLFTRLVGNRVSSRPDLLPET